MGGWWRWALVSPDGVTPSRMVAVYASVNLPLHRKVQKFSSGTGSPGWSRKKGRKMVVVWWWWLCRYLNVHLWHCSYVMIMLLTHAVYVVDYAWLLSVQTSSCCQAIHLSRFHPPCFIEWRFAGYYYCLLMLFLWMPSVCHCDGLTVHSSTGCENFIRNTHGILLIFPGEYVCIQIRR